MTWRRLWQSPSNDRVVGIAYLHIYLYLCAVKIVNRYRRGLTYLIAALMVVAVSSRLYLIHGRDYYDTLAETAQTAAQNGEWYSCDCLVCHAEDCLATEAETFEYTPIITTLRYEYAAVPTAQANRVVVVSSLRGPPCLS